MTVNARYGQGPTATISHHRGRETSCRLPRRWWHAAWSGDPFTAGRFKTEAKASLPIATSSPDLEEVFDGLQKRRFAIRADHQVAEWSPG